MPGPLPDPKARRRNAPTIPTTDLPVAGRQDDPPAPPASYKLGEAGMAWWDWAWHLPQACAWDGSALYTAARRAILEDDLAALDQADDKFYVEEMLSGYEDADGDPGELAKVGRNLDALIGRLKRNATGSTSLMKEMRELDNKLGLNPEALAKLRWKIVDEEGNETEAPAPPPVKDDNERRRRLSVAS